MFTVYHAVLADDECQDSNKLKDLIRFGENATRCEEFRTWFGSSTSLIWTPQKRPPTFSSTDESSCGPDNDSTCEGTAEFSPDYNCVTNTGECRSPGNAVEHREHSEGGISPLLKWLLDKDRTNPVTTPESTSIKWCSCLSNKVQEVYQETQRQPLLIVNQLREKASIIGFQPNCRGKWIIVVSDLKDVTEVSLEDLWKDISKDICTGMVQHCTVSLQTDPSRVLVYTDFLYCAAIPEQFRCIRERVRQMSYVVHPHGDVLSWDGKKINF